MGRNTAYLTIPSLSVNISHSKQVQAASVPDCGHQPQRNRKLTRLTRSGFFSSKFPLSLLTLNTLTPFDASVLPHWTVRFFCPLPTRLSPVSVDNQYLVATAADRHTRYGVAAAAVRPSPAPQRPGNAPRAWTGRHYRKQCPVHSGSRSDLFPSKIQAIK